MDIKTASLEDAEAILAIYAHYCSTPITFELEPPGLDEMQRRIAETLQQYPWLVAFEDGVQVGYAYAHSFKERAAYRWGVETSVYVGNEFHGRGVGSALYERLLGTLKVLNFFIAVAGITLPNAASIKLHENFGFRKVGIYENIGFKTGAWHSVAFYQKILNEPSSSPVEPLLFRSLV